VNRVKQEQVRRNKRTIQRIMDWHNEPKGVKHGQFAWSMYYNPCDEWYVHGDDHWSRQHYKAVIRRSARPNTATSGWSGGRRVEVEGEGVGAVMIGIPHRSPSRPDGCLVGARTQSVMRTGGSVRRSSVCSRLYSLKRWMSTPFLSLQLTRLSPTYTRILSPSTDLSAAAFPRIFPSAATYNPSHTLISLSTPHLHPPPHRHR